MKLVTKENVHIPFLVMDVNNHQQIKSLILKDINIMYGKSENSENHNIFKTDLNVDKFLNRPYLAHIHEILTFLCYELTNHFGYPSALQLSKFWYEQHTKGNYSSWSSSAFSSFSGVYFVDLPKGSSKKSFKLLDMEFDFDDVEEGQILIFPSFLLNSTKENLSVNTKTVICFNLNHFGS